MNSESFDTQIEQIRKLLSLLQGEIALLEESYQSALSVLRCDDLTGLLRREAFLSEFDLLTQKARTHGQKVGLLVIDIDHFKKINDQFGHSVGDRVIQRVSRKIQQFTRHQGIAGRWGGEEFVVALSGSESQIIAQAEHLRKEIAQPEFGFSPHDCPCTVSLGVRVENFGSGFHGRELFDEVFSKADAALYEAKESGRNQVRAA